MIVLSTPPHIIIRIVVVITNNGDSSISIRQLDSVYAYGRNDDNNINNHNTPSQDPHNHNPILNSIHINNISQQDLHSSDITNNKENNQI